MNRINERSVSKVVHGREMKDYNIKPSGILITN
jgi:hypothetical protein